MRKDGSEFEIELGVQEVELSDGKKSFCGYMRDLTQQKKDKRALQKQARMIHNKFFGAEEGDVGEGAGESEVTKSETEEKSWKSTCLLP